jgi:hypothetical protein
MYALAGAGQFPPLLSHGKTKGFRQVVPRNTPSPERYIFGVKAIIISGYSCRFRFIFGSVFASG